MLRTGQFQGVFCTLPFAGGGTTVQPGALVAVARRGADTGEGMLEDGIGRIWDRFYRVEKSRKRGPTSADGAGLGLAIVRGIVELHGGSVEVASSPGRGASFTVLLPR